MGGLRPQLRKPGTSVSIGSALKAKTPTASAQWLREPEGTTVVQHICAGAVHRSDQVDGGGGERVEGGGGGGGEGERDDRENEEVVVETNATLDAHTTAARLRRAEQRPATSRGVLGCGGLGGSVGCGLVGALLLF